jgi:hypothetical protein
MTLKINVDFSSTQKFQETNVTKNKNLKSNITTIINEGKKILSNSTSETPKYSFKAENLITRISEDIHTLLFDSTYGVIQATTAILDQVSSPPVSGYFAGDSHLSLNLLSY